MTDIADIIAGELGVSRGTAYDMMRAALAAQSADAQCSPTLTECPRCKNDIRKCDGAFAPLTEPELRSGIALQLREIERLRGENAVLAGILSDCDNVLATIVAEDLDEAEKIGDLRMALAYALDPYKREGTLL